MGTVDFDGDSFFGSDDMNTFLRPFSSSFSSTNPSLSSSFTSVDEVVLKDGGYTMLSTPATVRVPKDASPYASASRDLNPIHSSCSAARLAGLPGGRPIMHGMWTAQMARVIVQHNACGGDGERLVHHRCGVHIDGGSRSGTLCAVDTQGNECGERS